MSVRTALPRVGVWCVLALVVVGCSSESSTELSTIDETTTSVEVEVDESPSVAEQPQPEPLGALDVEEEVAVADDEWLAMIHDVDLGPEGFVYGAASAGIAYLDGVREWMILDLDGLPIGEELEGGLPGRMISNIEVGSDGVVWVSGSAHSTAEDEDFGGEIDGWFGGRYLEFVVRGDCSGTDCTWVVYTSDDVPGLVGIGDLAVDATGTVYVAGGNEPAMFVFDGQEWLTYAVEELDNNVSPWSSSLAVTSDGTVWAGTNAPEFGRGLYAFDGSEFKHYTTEDGLPSDSTFQVSAYTDGGPLWVATDGLYPDTPDEDDAEAAAGIISFDGTTWAVHTMADGLLTNDGFVAAGPDGTAWVLHSEVPPFGVAHYDGTAWVAEESRTTPGGFRSAADLDGSLWFASDLGLNHYDGVATTVYESPFIEAATTVESLWMNNSWGVLLSVTPPLLPPVRGTYDVTVHGFHSGEQAGVWVTSCPGARGVVDADEWQPAQEPGILDSMCALGEDHPVETGDFIDGAFETIVRVEIDETAIEHGGVVITTGDIWVPVAGNVLLRVGDGPQTPWEESYDGLNMSRLTQVVSYWPPFVVNFDETYDALRSCEEAYASANDGQDSYLDALATWDDTQRDKPGYEYDKAVARLIASERWLHDHTCPGRFDFSSVG